MLGLYFDFEPVACGAAVGSGTTTAFFDFMTMATMRCSSMRKARTILEWATCEGHDERKSLA